ncbi:putative protoheme ferro-lyase [Besnoitia besnoiti]|uniref:Putative protoheme ferro-lyase n=1 Tax=Besnoitia besnoiti TaxID=94643 RepID=A0A2A9M5M0_BESBE|nr:putative protoheme ferro-lyase [Besnoitia besnoiti]PFH33255.1 putative protoheme ferro-lyase [Besnoitia besnoiti]
MPGRVRGLSVHARRYFHAGRSSGEAQRTDAAVQGTAATVCGDAQGEAWRTEDGSFCSSADVPVPRPSGSERGKGRHTEGQGEKSSGCRGYREDEEALWQQEVNSLGAQARMLQCVYHENSPFLRGETRHRSHALVPAWLLQGGQKGETQEGTGGKSDGAAVCVVLVNLGSPSKPTYRHLWRYLNQFLGDSRVVEVPTALWFLIRHSFILPFRSYASAKKYHSIWHLDPGASHFPSLCHRPHSPLPERRLQEAASAVGRVQHAHARPHAAPQASAAACGAHSHVATGEAKPAAARATGDLRRATGGKARGSSREAGEEPGRELSATEAAGRVVGQVWREARAAARKMRARDFTAPAPLVRITEALRREVQARFDRLADELRAAPPRREEEHGSAPRSGGGADAHSGGGSLRVEGGAGKGQLSAARVPCGGSGVCPPARPEDTARSAGRAADEEAGARQDLHVVDACGADASRRLRPGIRVLMGMRYGEPSLPSVLREAQRGGCRKLLILPLYPQTANATTSSVYDAALEEIMKWRVMPDLRILSGYADHPAYIGALAASIRRFWEAERLAQESAAEAAVARLSSGRGEKLIFSFHGIPISTGRQAGEIYQCLCAKTARLVAEELHLKPEECEVAFQSRFGPAEWTKPYIDRRLEALAAAGVRVVDVVMPGFATDCLETIEEMGCFYSEKFHALTKGRGRLRVIPCLNASAEASSAIFTIAREQMTDWLRLMK